MKRLIVLSGFLIFMLGCYQVEIPEGILKENKMKEILKDIHLTDAYLSSLSNPDSVEKVAPAYYQRVFSKHQIDTRLFEKSLKFYAANPVLLDSMYSQINADFQKTLKKIPHSAPKNIE